MARQTRTASRAFRRSTCACRQDSGRRSRQSTPLTVRPVGTDGPVCPPRSASLQGETSTRPSGAQPGGLFVCPNAADRRGTPAERERTERHERERTAMFAIDQLINEAEAFDEFDQFDEREWQALARCNDGTGS